ncbi:MAG TPA: aspartyl/asparaginyl beta-hydroxylase domain-containing protein [Blastocatellia bacterium]
MALDSFKLPMTFDPERLKQDLDQISPGEWSPHFNTGYYEGEWSGVALRSVGGLASQLYPDPAAPKPFADTPVLARCAHIQSALASFKCALESVRLLKLSAGSRIREHKDHKLSLEDGVARIHVPIVTDPRVEFYVDSRRLVMNEGECWYINFNLPHRVYNHSDADRVHLVVDCIVNDWLRLMIPAGDERGGQQAPDAATGARESGAFKESFERFRQLVLEDAALQERLRGTPNLKAFVDLMLRLGEERGYRFTAEDIEGVLRESRRAWLQRWI